MRKLFVKSGGGWGRGRAVLFFGLRLPAMLRKALQAGDSCGFWATVPNSTNNNRPQLVGTHSHSPRFKKIIQSYRGPD